jgi:hypothetical protein
MMKKVFCALFLAALLGSCGTDNSSNVQFTLDGNGCLVQASNFDWTEESPSGTFRTVNYRWECGEYTSPFTGNLVSNKRVTLTFVGTACLRLTAEIVGDGYCTDTKLKLN